MMIENRQAFGVVGGLGALAGADFLQHLIRATAAEPERYAIAFEQQSFPGDRLHADGSYDPIGRKLHAFSLIRRLEQRGVDAILLPCFISQTFIDEIAPNVGTQIFGMIDALRAQLAADHPDVKRVGVLTSGYVREKGLFDRAFERTHRVVYPNDEAQRRLMEAVYSAGGIKAGRSTPELMEDLGLICVGLVEAGCEIIVPGFTELSLVHDVLSSSVQVPVINANQCYAEFARNHSIGRPQKHFKIGVVGGVGPLATVDFMSKVVKLTQVPRDQDHIKMIVEQNPQIPDRTDHLVRNGTDPTIAMFATCKKLEAAEADLIAIPCNTAHAFVDRMQTHLRVPVLNMLDETMVQVANQYPYQRAGLLATSGTIESGIYAAAAHRTGVEMIVPDADHQRLVMEAIYGPAGVKAGFTEGQCQDDLRRAIVHLARRGARVVILGCTELPLIFPQSNDFDAGRANIALLDPTLLLAAACVRHAQAFPAHRS